MAINIWHFGGYTGSYAGDCCVIGNDGHFLMIDLGRNQGQTSLKPAGTQATKAIKKVGTGKADIDVIVTHFHNDHINGGGSWAQLAKQGARLHYGAAAVEKGHEDIVRDHFGNAATLYTSAQNGDQIINKDIGGWQLAVWVIVPTFAGMQSLDENDASLGVLIELTKANQNTVRILSVGDMTERAGNAALAKVLKDRGYGNGGNKVTSVKLSHHGSESNLLSALDDVIGGDTTVLISGYTMTATSTLANKLKNWKPKRVRMLFDTAGLREFNAMGPANMKLLQEATVDFQILEDFWVELQ
jgi:beta-lactamase superfamily II metal-dependent hydrolase